MDNVIPWSYVKLRIAIKERRASIDAAYAEVRKTGKVEPTTVARCHRSDAMLKKALDEV